MTSRTNSSNTTRLREALKEHAAAYQVQLTEEILERLSEYYNLINTWSPRLHLIAPCSPEEFATRHLLESLLLVRYLPEGAEVADIGSGAGLPIIPCLLARPEIRATLIESSKKKALFLREALKQAGSGISATVIAERFQEVRIAKVEFVTCRALERLTETLPDLVEWSPPSSTLLLFAGEALRQKIQDTGLSITELRIPQSERRFLIVARRKNLFQQ
jgi:16S rRNA (guanine527-N7)-methyltransferase